VDDVSWGVLTLGLTLLGGIYTWFAYQRRGITAAIRGAALTLVPLAAYLTKTLQMFTRIADAITDWATSLVFSPRVWLGVLVAGVSVALFAVSGALSRRKAKREGVTKAPKRLGRAKEQPAGGASIVDDDMADIEAILRDRGIT
jgi:hypothetical protein